MNILRNRNFNKKGQDYSIISDLLGDSGLVKSMIPQSLDEVFDLADGIVPGMKALQEPLNKTWSLLKPVLLVNQISSKTSRMLSTVTLNCLVTKIVMNSGSTLL